VEKGRGVEAGFQDLWMLPTRADPTWEQDNKNCGFSVIIGGHCVDLQGAVAPP
jgi:hypothetical protein